MHKGNADNWVRPRVSSMGKVNRDMSRAIPISSIMSDTSMRAGEHTYLMGTLWRKSKK